jgi:hypothetical protein
MKELIIKQVTSGRFIFTVIAAFLLYHGTVTGKFAPDKVLDIIKDVVIFYFIVKQSLTQNGGTK